MHLNVAAKLMWQPQVRPHQFWTERTLCRGGRGNLQQLSGLPIAILSLSNRNTYPRISVTLQSSLPQIKKLSKEWFKYKKSRQSIYILTETRVIIKRHMSWQKFKIWLTGARIKGLCQPPNGWICSTERETIKRHIRHILMCLLLYRHSKFVA